MDLSLLHTILNNKGLDGISKLILIIIQSEIDDSCDYVQNNYIAECANLPKEVIKEKIKYLLQIGILEQKGSTLAENGFWSTKYQIMDNVEIVVNPAIQQKDKDWKAQREANKEHLKTLKHKIGNGVMVEGFKRLGDII